MPGVVHAHARARWTGRTLRVEIEGWVDADLPARDADAIGRLVADEICTPASRGGQLDLDDAGRASVIAGPDEP